jgi:hypothetical protein
MPSDYEKYLDILGRGDGVDERFFAEKFGFDGDHSKRVVGPASTYVEERQVPVIRVPAR